MKKILMLLLLAFNASFVAFAQHYFEEDDPFLAPSKVIKYKDPEEVKKDPLWFFSFDGGAALAFGDDSWNLKKDMKNAKGSAFSVSFGRKFSNVFSARVKARYLQLFSRVNLEVLEAYRDIYPDFFPRDGFYGYRGLALQAEAMINLTHLIPKYSFDFLNVFLVAGAGGNTLFDYDENVSNWDGSYEGLIYRVNTKPHTMPLGVVGGIISFKLSREFRLNFEMMGTFTDDLMEGVKYEEPYDVYVTYGVGATIFF